MPIRRLNNGSKHPISYEVPEHWTVDQIRLELLSFYQFLTKRFSREISMPPPDGWGITLPDKCEEVNKLVNHIPFITGEVQFQLRCVDVRNEHKSIGSPRTIALFWVEEHDFYLLFHVDDGRVEFYNPEHGSSEGRFFQSLTLWIDLGLEVHEDCHMYPVNTDQVSYCQGEEDREAVQRIFEQHGWPESYDKLACLRAIRAHRGLYEYGVVDHDIDPVERTDHEKREREEEQEES